MNQIINLKSLDFTRKKIANLLGVSKSFWSPYFCNRPFCGRKCCKTSTNITCCRSRWFIYTTTLWSSLLSPALPPPLVLENSFSNSWWTDGCYFSSISPFAMFAKSINDFTIYFGGTVTIHDPVYERHALTTGCLYCFNELTVWQVCVGFLPSISLGSKSKQRAENPTRWEVD